MSSRQTISPNSQRAIIESPYIRSLLAGGLAGTTVDLSLYPLDTLKTRLQSSAGFHASGGFRGIYAGVGSAIVGSAPGAALFFVTYDTVKRRLSSNSNSRQRSNEMTISNTSWTEPAAHMAAASLGEIAACAVRVPTEVVKQRAQALQHPSSLAALRHILSQRRTHSLARVWSELYRGWGITVMREVPFTVIQFPLWEALKKLRLAQTGRGYRGEQVTAWEGAVAGSLAGAVAAGFTTPLDVLKTRMMLAREKVRAGEMLARIMRENGLGALFAGLGPRVGWISAGGAIFLGSYQWAINLLGGEG